MEWHIGCSGFHYKDWKGRFYPADLPQRKWFDYYCEHFKTLELNVTFYRFPQLSFLQNWYGKSPADFRFAVKAPRAITHYKKFNDTAELITSFYDTINQGLQEKLGPVLFQLPPSFTYDDEKLDRIISSLNHSFKNVLEFRHVSWWNKSVYERLAKHNITFCDMSHPSLPDDVIQNTPIVYYRFHGVPVLYRSPYSIDFLEKIINTVKQNPDTREGWFYFNNDFDAVGVGNANDMISLTK
ncbi:Uncharacterized conserved protein YecE, DUF72 family [Mucilaginibacter lappiensis]|uniref:Uncharacterized protein YecE (DUF72 family) n=1 Tax=Mucilaginibacter lappiensis TaxID=354630 RepID=A0ABR6PC15_9SPHI|nr:DUF72 domain-containing protein [Mucilaginibacter lappiensis]MBB6107287.1 uncharacterized protein YecE (DUF72 family) [Mucilaginibacter lappiensis]SIQ13567.1 Uncharacterized conserved protein YecE, DUF72 family [Mucilaginibacter lappiensis]